MGMIKRRLPGGGLLGQHGIKAGVIDPIISSLDFTQSPYKIRGSDATITQNNAHRVWTITDHESVPRGIRQNELPIGGLRRVRNILSSGTDNNFTAASWIKSGSSTALAADTISFGGAGGAHQVAQAITLAVDRLNRSFIMRLSVPAVSAWSDAAATLTLAISNTSLTFTPQSVARVVTVAGTYTTSSSFAYATLTASKAVTITGLRSVLYEESTGRGDLVTPSAYIDTTVNYGLGVAGVRQSDTTNGNTVDGNGVVTEGTGTAITTGYLPTWEASTNLSLRSAELDDVYWTVTDSTVAANDAAGPFGTTTADKVTATSTAGLIYSSNIAVSAETTYTFSFYAKLGTMVGPKLALYDVTGAAFISSDVAYTPSSSAYTRVTATFTTPIGCVNLRVYPLRNCTTIGTIWIEGVQVEQKAYASAYIPTTSATVTRNALTLLTENRHKDAQGSKYVEFQLPTASSNLAGKHIWSPSTTATTGIYINSVDFKLRAGDGTNTVDSIILAANTRYKCVLVWEGSVMRLTVNGITYSGTYDGAMHGTTQRLGGLVGGTSISARIYKERGFNYALSSADAIVLTS